MDTRPYTFVQTNTMDNAKSKHELWTMGVMMCQCRFILGLKKKYTIVVSDIANGRGSATVRKESGKS